MYRSYVTSALIALALTCTVATRASAQNPFNINGVVPDTGIPATADPSGSAKELGPKNASTTKVGVINGAASPMLEFTNPNGQVDLRQVYMQTKRAVNGDLWLYFGWQRDANTGSGFIAFEFEQQKVAASCVYTGTDIDQILPQSAAETTLINTCNPWRNRQTGDFLILWDQGGSSLNITKRVYTQGVGFGAPQNLGTAVAAVGSCEGVANSNGFCGEAAINVTEDVFKGVTSCLTFANIIPGTVTGNSDSADYKDTVFATFPPVSNCGSVQVIKKTTPAGEVGTFPFTLARTSGNVRFNGTATLGDTLTQDGDSRTYIDLIPGRNYTLSEAAQTSPWSLASIVCVFDGENPYDAMNGNSFPVGVGETTVCTITNQRLRGSITVIKIVVDDNGGTATSSSFTMSLGDGTTPSFPGSSSGETFTFDEGHTFNVTEIGPSGYTATTSGDCSGTIVAGVTKVCTVTNNDVAPRLTVIKKVLNPNGGSALPDAFKPSVGGTVVVSGTTNAYSANAALVINETPLTGYEFVSITGDAKCPSALGGSITLAPGDNVTCTITNTDVAPKLTVVKVVVKDNGGTALPNDFKLTVSGAAVLSGVKNSYQSNMALAINETQLSGYHFVSITGDAKCPAVLGGTVTLVPGDDITCTITNDDDKAGPVGATDQAATLRDSITITNIRTGASDAASARVTFRLYSDAGCSNQIGSEGPIALGYAGTTATAATINGVVIDPAPAAAQTGTFSWRVTYTGDQFNTGFTTACGDEKTTVTFSPK
jgi:hypothetical protein